MHYGVKYTVTDSACDQWRAPTSHWNLPSGVNSLNRERSVDISVVKNDTPGWYLLMDSLLLHLVTFNMQVMLLIFTVNHYRISDWMVAHTLSAKLLVGHWMGNVILVFSRSFQHCGFIKNYTFQFSINADILLTYDLYLPVARAMEHLNTQVIRRNTFIWPLSDG